MIQDFSVSNFYCIREQQGINFMPSSDTSMIEQYSYEVKPNVRLLKLGIIYGANASGKSTVLQALEYFRNIMLIRPTAKTDGMGFLPFMLDNYSRNEHSKMQLTFFLEGEKHVLGIEFDQQRIYNEELSVYTTIRPTLLYKRTYQNDTDHSIITFGSKVKLSKKSQNVIAGNTINNCSVLAAFGQTNVETSRLNKVFDFFIFGMRSLLQPRMSMLGYVKNALKNDSSGQLKDFILQVLKASDFNIVDFVLDENEENITPDIEKALKNAPIPEDERINVLKEGILKHDDLIFHHTGQNGKYELNEIVESQGTKRFMGMAVMLYNLLKNNCFIPIDEVETSIHYELLSYFIKLFLVNSEGMSQLLLTTHDINLLNEDFIRRDAVWFTDKDEYGATSIKRLSSLGLHKTLSPYNAYKQGKLVKLPFTGSIYLENA